MALTLGDNFSYQGSKPLDARLKYDTLATMKAVGDATMYEGCLAYCVETDKTYQWKSTNTVDADTGRWREYESGGGGHAIEDSTGTTLTQRETLQFGEGLLAEDDATNEKTVVKPDAFQEGDMDDVVDILPSGGRVVATGFTPVGTIIPVMGVHAPKNFLICDGTVYNIADYPELASYFEREFDESNHFGGNGTTTFAVPDLRGEFIRGAGTNSHTNQGSGGEVGEHQDSTRIASYESNNSSGSYVLPVANETYGSGLYDADSRIDNSVKRLTLTGNIASTKAGYQGTVRPTNTSVLFCIAIKDIYTNPINDYSTEEKVVGSWINGKTLYQKTIETTIPTTATEYTNVTRSIVLDTSTDMAFITNAFMFDNSKASTPLPTSNGKHTDPDMWYTHVYILYSSGTPTLTIDNNRTAYNGRTAYITIQYTKS